MIKKTSLPVILVAIFILGHAVWHRVVTAQPAAQLPAGAQALKIVVQSVVGNAVFVRGGARERLTTANTLEQGDSVVCDVGSVTKLEFQHPTSTAVLSAAILKGYTAMTVAEAYQQGESSRTQLDVPQGIVRVGVVRTAVPPSFRVRTPRVVVGIRGSEIRQLEASNDLGDVLAMGREGIAMTHDAWGLFRSSRHEQGTRKRLTNDRRVDTLLRAIENELLEYRIFLNGPHRTGTEDWFDEQSFDVLAFNAADRWKRDGNAQRDREVNHVRGQVSGRQGILTVFGK